MSSTESLAQLAAGTASAFTTLWTGAGVPQPEQDAILADLVASMRALVDGAMHEQQEKLESFKAELPKLRSELALQREVLGGEIKANPQEDAADVLLVPQRQALLDSLDIAKKSRAERMDQRTSKEEQLASVRAELDGAEGPAPDEIESRRTSLVPDADAANGLSLATLGKLQAKVDAAQDEKAARISTLKGLRETAASLRKTLGYPADEAADASISRATIAAAQTTITEYEAEVTRRQAVLADCGEYINSSARASRSRRPSTPCCQRRRRRACRRPSSRRTTPRWSASSRRRRRRSARSSTPRVAGSVRFGRSSTCRRPRRRPSRPAGPRRPSRPGAPTEAGDAERLEEDLDAVEEEEKRLKAKIETCGEALT